MKFCRHPYYSSSVRLYNFMSSWWRYMRMIKWPSLFFSTRLIYLKNGWLIFTPISQVSFSSTRGQKGFSPQSFFLFYSFILILPLRYSSLFTFGTPKKILWTRTHYSCHILSILVTFCMKNRIIVDVLLHCYSHYVLLLLLSLLQVYCH